MEDWIAEDGLLCLEPLSQGGDRKPWGKSKLRTCSNDNGILYLAELDTLQPQLNTQRVRIIIKRLEQQSGVFNRNPDRNDPTWHVNLEAHDNTMAISILSRRYGLMYHHDIVKHGQGNFWIYNNIHPNSLFNPKYFKENLRALRPPKEVATYKLLADRSAIFSSIFLSLDLIWGAHQPAKGKGSGLILTWLRLEGLKNCKLPWHVKLAANYWNKKLLEKTNGRGINFAVEEYFTNKNHPIRLAIK